MKDEIKKKLLERLNAPPDPPLEATRKFLLTYCADRESMAEVESFVERMARQNNVTLIEGLSGIERLLADPPKEKGVLAQLVGWEVAWVLDDPSDDGVKDWLRELAEMLRRHLGDQKT